jgi:hypothetical protein
MKTPFLIVGELCGVPVALTPEAFEEARAHAETLLPTKAASNAPAEKLYTAQELEQATAVPASWFEEAARCGRITVYRFGRYPRFRLEDAMKAARQDRR